MIHHSGRIEVICGSMFCGKTEELIRRVRRAIIARQTVQVFNSEIDTRYGVERITSHNGENIAAQSVKDSSEILKLIQPQTTVVAIDEVQWFDSGIVGVAETLANQNLRVILAGLDLDFRAEPFGSMPHLMSIAEEVTKLRAICVICGEHACRSQRLVNGQPASYNDQVIMVGAQETYEARCRQHHTVPGAPHAHHSKVNNFHNI